MWNGIHDVFSEWFGPEFQNAKGPLRKLRAGLANLDFSSLQVGDRPSETRFTGSATSATSATGGALARSGRAMEIEDEERAHRG
jgi:hypothetical protein